VKRKFYNLLGKINVKLTTIKRGDCMLRTILLFMILFVHLSPIQPEAAKNPSQLKAAFVRNDDLWIKIGNKERQITTGEYVRYPKWSPDGQ
jgi:hypothetical protein